RADLRDPRRGCPDRHGPHRGQRHRQLPGERRDRALGGGAGGSPGIGRALDAPHRYSFSGFFAAGARRLGMVRSHLELRSLLSCGGDLHAATVATHPSTKGAGKASTTFRVALSELKANENFLRLQDELAGTENRIAVERRRYNETVQDYNTYISLFPASLVAG